MPGPGPEKKQRRLELEAKRAEAAVLRERRRTIIMDLTRRGLLPHEIEDKTKVCAATVKRDVAAVLHRLSTIQRQDAEVVRADLKSKHTYIYAEAVAAWEKSKCTRTKTRKRVVEKGDAGGKPSKREATVEEWEMHGDPRYLQQAESALIELAKLDGVYAPQQVNIKQANTLMQLVIQSEQSEDGGGPRIIDGRELAKHLLSPESTESPNGNGKHVIDAEHTEIEDDPDEY